MNRVERTNDTNVQINKSIGCTVRECKYHAKSENYCSLDHIKVVKHEGEADSVKCTDCGSFEPETKVQ